MAGNRGTDIPFECSLNAPVDKYVELSNHFTQDVSAALIEPMQVLFFAMISLWVVVQGFKIAMGSMKLLGFGSELFFVSIAYLLLFHQGPNLVNDIYLATLSVIGSGSSVVLDVAAQNNNTGFAANGLEGMGELVCYTEKSMYNVIGIAGTIAKQTTLTNPLPVLYAIVLVLPYILVIIAYFSQVVTAIFRIMFLAAISPYLMMMFGFGFFREESINGIRTLLASFLVLFGATIAVAVLVYGVSDLGSITDNKILSSPEGLSLHNVEYLVVVIMGWLGTAFLTEATGLANSITRSTLSNTTAGIITAGVAGSGMALLSKVHPASALALKGAKLLGGAVKPLSDEARASNQPSSVQQKADALVEKYKSNVS